MRGNMGDYRKKTISFHKEKDRRIIDHIDSLPNFSGYVRQLIEADLDRKPPAQAAAPAPGLAEVQRIVRAEINRAMAGLSVNVPVEAPTDEDEVMVAELEANLLDLF